jgi:hypothetical protein
MYELHQGDTQSVLIVLKHRKTFYWP